MNANIYRPLISRLFQQRFSIDPKAVPVLRSVTFIPTASYEERAFMLKRVGVLGTATLAVVAVVPHASATTATSVTGTVTVATKAGGSVKVCVAGKCRTLVDLTGTAAILKVTASFDGSKAVPTLRPGACKGFKVVVPEGASVTTVSAVLTAQVGKTAESQTISVTTDVSPGTSADACATASL